MLKKIPIFVAVDFKAAKAYTKSDGGISKMKTTTYKGVSLLIGGRESKTLYDVSVADGIITAVEKSDALSPSGYLSAGFVDLHTHGCKGHEFSSCTKADFDETVDWYLENGVTHFSPTFVATELATLEKQLNRLYSFTSDDAAVLPAHMEGPFIDLKYKGAQPARNVYGEYEDNHRTFFENNADKIGIVTLCPTVKGAKKLTALCTSLGIKTQVGHSAADYDEITACEEEGLDGVTHIYCGCSQAERKGLSPKTLGVAETALAKKDLFVEMIPDGKHLSVPLMKFVIERKGYRRVMLVSDSLSCAGMPVGTYKLGEDDVFNDGKVCVRADKSGIAGSVISLADGVKILVENGIPLAEAAYMASETPRKYIGLSVPALEIGEKADFVLLDEKGNLLSVLCAQ